MLASGIVTSNTRNPPLPSPAILNLLAQFGIQYPGNAVQAPDVNYTTLQTAAPDESFAGQVLKFLTQLYPQMQPTESTSVAFSGADDVTLDTDVTSNIFNFAAISNNGESDILPPETAIAMNAAVVDLEQTFSPYALSFIMDIFTKHMEDIIDNPHHTSTLVNVWNDFFQYLYNKYSQLVSAAASLDEFISEKTTGVSTATLAGWMTPAQLLFAVTLQVGQAIIALHNDATDASIHPALQDALTSAITYPNPMFSVTPELFLNRYNTNPSSVSGLSVDSTNLTASQKIEFYLQSYYAGDAEAASTSELINIGTQEKVGTYYAATLNQTFPQAQGTIFLNAVVDMNSAIAISVIKFANLLTGDSLEIIKELDTTTGYHIVVNVGGVITDTIIPVLNDTLIMAITYSGTGLSVSQWNGTTTTVTPIALSNMYYDYNMIQIGLPAVRSWMAASINYVQELTIYPTILSADQINVLFNS